jgi:hypothetical protein
MPRKKYKPEQIITLLQQVEVELATERNHQSVQAPQSGYNGETPKTAGPANLTTALRAPDHATG